MMNNQIKQALERGPHCPELSDLFAAMEMPPGSQQRTSAERHLETCAACQTEWALFREFEAAEVRPEEIAAVNYIVERTNSARPALETSRNAHRPTLWQRFLTPALTPAKLGGAAIVLAALILAIGLTTQWRARQIGGNIYTDDQTLRSQTLEITTPLSALTRTPETIDWKPVNGAASYTISLTEVDDNQVFYTKITSSPLPLPKEVSNLLQQGKTLFLNVSASDAAGREIARSEKIRIRVTSAASGNK